MSLVNQPAPDFSLPDDTGTIRKLSDYLGRYVLLYFYPKDMTPGCTREAECFRDNIDDLQKSGVEVLGVSADSVESHQKFKEAHNLNFPLLADENKEVVQLYGVWDGKTRRESFLINPEGIIVKHYANVDPETHAQEVLEYMRSL